jgi:hypothetical protein
MSAGLDSERGLEFVEIRNGDACDRNVNKLKADPSQRLYIVKH